MHTIDNFIYVYKYKFYYQKKTFFYKIVSAISHMAQPHLAKSRVLSDSKITTELAIKKMNRFKSNATEITDRRVQMKSKQMGERFQCCWAKRKEISGQNAMFVSSGLPNSTHKNQNHMYAT